MSKKGTKRTIHYFFKPKVDVVHDRESPPDGNNQKEDVHDTHPSDQKDVNDNHMNESPRVEPEKDVHNSAAVNLDSLIRDPGARPSISSFPSDHQDEIRREYIRLGPYQLSKKKYPLSRGGPNGRMRSFQEVWFKRFWWLEYSETKDAAYCLPCYLFNKKPVGRVGSDRFTKQGFNRWKKVNCGNDCAFMIHVGKTSASAHNFSVRCYEALKNQSCHIENVIEKQTEKEVIENRLRLKTSIESVKWLTVQTCGLRGSDERPGSKNQGNLLELRNDQLIDAQVAEIAHLAEIGELETGKGQNQIQSVQRPGDTRWSSHFRSICSLMSLYGPAYVVLSDIAVTGSTTSQKGDAAYCLEHLLSFDFVIGMHIMKEIMEITDKLCQALQHKSQDIINALALVSTTKTLLQKLRDEGWQSLMGKVILACENNNIPIPDMNATYRNLIQSRKKNNVTVEHHYRVDVFFAAIDRQLVELNSRFNESVTELLRLSVALDPRKSFNIDDICKLVMKYYPLDFTDQEKIQLKAELQHYELDVRNHPRCKSRVHMFLMMKPNGICDQYCVLGVPFDVREECGSGCVGVGWLGCVSAKDDEEKEDMKGGDVLVKHKPLETEA
ncbi:hypothetical protein CTI12_AA120840 [Artemisia annua]|uniref:TTF-type domain-containing protein n=1 Tax=Artemisia annua TaxID=35608 RepID=A0A2U1PRH6_ARTAN|nr:hypothetical protein CTI12_AA120840 [Artemisia annua]